MSSEQYSFKESPDCTGNLEFPENENQHPTFCLLDENRMNWKESYIYLAMPRNNGSSTIRICMSCFKYYTEEALKKFNVDSKFDGVSNINKKNMFSSDIQKSEVINFQTFSEKLRKSKQLENLINIWNIKPNTESTDLSKMVIDVIEKMYRFIY